MGKTIILLLAGLFVVSFLAACSDTPSSFGKTYRGRSLDVKVLAMDRMQELRYTNTYPTGVIDHHRLMPSEAGKELVLLRLSVGNQTATSHIVNVNNQAAELQDFFQGKYFPLDIAAKGQSWARQGDSWEWVNNSDLTDLTKQTQGSDVPEPPDWRRDTVRQIQVDADGTPPGQGFLVGTFQLEKGFAVDGWLVFETPIGTEIRFMRWRAGDSLTIPF